MNLKNDDLHPLRRLWLDASEERNSPMDFAVEDRGSWKGQWPLPSRSEWQAVEKTKQLWPRGEQEASVVQTARKEYRWKQMNAEEKVLYKEAADKGWQIWVDNEAVDVLSPEESQKVRSRLRQEGESHRILTPRFVYTDKNDGLRTSKHPLPARASARIVVPGFRDVSAYDVRKDAPTASRISVHLLLTFTASFMWTLLSADIKSAF